MSRKARINRPTLVDILMVFGPVDALFKELLAGEVSSIDDVPVLATIEGHFTAAPALVGLADLWERLKKPYRIDINLEPLTALANKLHVGELLTLSEVGAAHQVVETCRKQVRGMDINVIKTLVRAQQAEIALDAAMPIERVGNAASISH